MRRKGEAAAAGEGQRTTTVFRPDIQALRAIAMLAVVLYHLWPNVLPGGFVGVDIFFVISGFLITRHLMSELEETGTIKLREFWARRIRRLLPAALVVLLACAVITVAALPLLAVKPNLQQIAAALTYVENWALAIKGVDYLASVDKPSLVQHYWSLSVEEQFYLFWPLMLLAAFALSRSGWSRRFVPVQRVTARSTVRAVLCVVLLASLSLCIYLTWRKQPYAFFSTPTRAWEFASGALAALVGRTFKRHRIAASWGGLFAILASFFWIGPDSAVPGLRAVLPVAGTVLVILAGAQEGRWSAGFIHRWKPVQWLGDHSYSFYLWHWPLIIAGGWLVARTDSWSVECAILLALPLLAYATDRYIERPVRSGAFWTSSIRRSYAGASAGMILVGLVAFAGYQRADGDIRQWAGYASAPIADRGECFGAAAVAPGHRCGQPFIRPGAAALAFAVEDLGPAGKCQVPPDTPTPTYCTFGELVAPVRTIALVGNSHALRMVPTLEEFGKARRWKIILAAKTDCQGLSTKPIGKQSAGDTCVAWTNAVQDHLLSEKVDLVLFQGHVRSWNYLAGNEPTEAALQAARVEVMNSFARFRRNGIPVAVIGDVPGTRPDAAPECIYKFAAAYDACARAAADVHTSSLQSDLAKLHPELAGYVDVESLLCTAGVCHAAIGGVVVYSDSHHLTGTFARTLAPYIGPAVERLMKPGAAL